MGFKTSPTTPPVLKSSISIAGPHPLFPNTTSPPSLSESSAQESDWLNCTYSNGELAGFRWPADTAASTSVSPKGLTPASSTPALKKLPPTPSTPPNQRWSACVTTPCKDDCDHIYSSIGPRTNKVSSYNRCQSSSSLIDQTRKETGGSGLCDQMCEVHGNESRTQIPRQHSLPECPGKATSDLSMPCDITLRDSQQVLVLNRQAPLNAQSATENYLANFKDNGDDDDDYVEIRSDDEAEEQKQEMPILEQLHSLPGTAVNYHSQPQSSQTQRNGHEVSNNSEMTLEGYQWNDANCSQGVNQPKIVQSIREKFQCLSSSSFA